MFLSVCPWACVPCMPKAHRVTWDASRWKNPAPVWASKSWQTCSFWGEGDKPKRPVWEKKRVSAWLNCCQSYIHLIVCSVGAFLLTSLSSLSEWFPNENVPRGLKSLWTCHANGMDAIMLLQWKRCRATSKLGPSEPFQPPARDSLFKNCFIRAVDSHKEHPISEALEVCQENEPGLSLAPSILHGKAAMSLQPLQPWTRSKAAFVPLFLSHVQKEACVHTSGSLCLLCSLDQNCLHA